jgi:hypothetical protein
MSGPPKEQAVVLVARTGPVGYRQMIIHAPEMLKALQRMTHPAADDDDLAYALEVIAKATGGAA